MPTESSDNGLSRDPDSSPPERRPRYRGTHPQKFEQRYKELNPEKYPDMQSHIREQGRTPAGTHVPILLSQVLEVLAPQSGNIVIDCTLGYGGHAQAFLERIRPHGRLIGIDVDTEELERTKLRLKEFEQHFVAVCASFAGIERVLADMELHGADVIFADLGVSSMQIDNPARGFSYKHDGPLDMRMGPRAKRTAADWLNRGSQNELTAALREFADEPRAIEIAAEIVRRRQARPLERSNDLINVVQSVAGADAVARVFQAVRILVNDELGALRNLLRVMPTCLKPGGRAGIITFHSGEDRLVKHAFRRGKDEGVFSEISDEPISPEAVERRSNPRSGSARLRWAKKSM